MPVFIDQTGRSIILNKAPRRIISLVPSQTELLFDLGADEEVIGITKFCVHPNKWFRTKTRIGGTKQLNMEIIHQLQPDLVLANKEENVKEQIEELEKHFPVWISDINNLADAYEMIEQIGLITSKEIKANKIIASIKENFAQLFTCLRVSNAPDLRLKTVYLIWQKPYMTIGGDTFIHSILEVAGFKNMYADKNRYPELTLKELQAKKPELLLLSSEPFPFKQKNIDEIQLQLPDTKIVLADGEMLSWYGSRLIKTPGYLKELLESLP